MGLLRFLQRGEAASAPGASAKAGSKSGARTVAESADVVQQLRLRARHRLIGAAVLVGVGVIGFPVLFETQPRPIPVDLPIDIPSKDALPPLQVPAQLQAPGLPVLPAAEEAAPEKTPSPSLEGRASVDTAHEKAAEQVSERATPVATNPAESRVMPVPVPVPEAKQALKVAEKQAEKKAVEPRADKTSLPPPQHQQHQQQEAARVQSLLEGKPAQTKAAESGVRSIVQVGAFADAKAAQETRMKVEKLGFKTYMQVVETSAGQRVRVRVGPFASKEEADKTAARLRAAGLTPAVLTI